MYALSNPEIEVSPNSYQYRVISVFADPVFDGLSSGIGFEKWENYSPSYRWSSSILLKKNSLIPPTLERYKLTAAMTPENRLVNKIIAVLPSGAKNLPESRWKAIWAELVKDPDIKNTLAFKHFERNHMIHPRPWYLKYGYAGLGGAALGVLVVGYGIFRLARRKD
jgi:hypothetical protein